MRAAVGSDKQMGQVGMAPRESLSNGWSTAPVVTEESADDEVGRMTCKMSPQSK